MKKMKITISMLLMASLLFIAVIACNKINPSAGTVKDVDGNVYNTVKIGTQVWMVENLNTTKYNDGTLIPNVSDNDTWGNIKTGAYCNYDNFETNATTFGNLYNWYAVNTGKLAPEGWHVPTDNDWTILKNYLVANGYDFNGTKNEDKIAKSLCSKTNWELSSDAGTPGTISESNNSTNFTALPGGFRNYDGRFNSIGKIGNWWSSTERLEISAYNWLLKSGSYNLSSMDSYKEVGFSVRLVRDN